MKLDQVAGSGNDEFYTPPYAVRPIIKYLQAKGYKTIWCPFDTHDSYFVKLLSEHGFSVTYTHLNEGQDFFALDLPCDCVVSNPPYSIKGQVLTRLFSLGKPFAMLVGIVGLFESEHRFSMFANNSFEILYLSRRIAYFKSFSEQRPSLNPPFSSVYVTSRVLPHQICFERIVK